MKMKNCPTCDMPNDTHAQRCGRCGVAITPSATSSSTSRLKYYSYGAAAWVAVGVALTGAMSRSLPMWFIALNACLVAVYLGLGFWSRRQPIAAATVTAVVFGLNALINLAGGAASGILFAAVFLGLLIRAIVAASKERAQTPMTSRKLPATQIFRAQP